MPHEEASLRTIYSYYLSTVNVNPEGDVNLSDELNLLGLGTGFNFSLVQSILPLQTLVEVVEVVYGFSLSLSKGESWLPGLGIILLQATCGFLCFSC